MELHLIVDNYCTHKHAKVKAWLAQRPRFHVHYTPHLCLLAEPGGALVRPDHSEGDPAGQLLQRQRADQEDQAVRGVLRQD